MFDLALDKNRNLYLDANQQLATISDGPEVGQSCEITLDTQTGEWFLDPDQGIDHIGKVLARPFRPGYAAREIRRGLMRVEEVSDITAIEVNKDPQERHKVNAEIDVLTIYGVQRISS